MTTRTAVQRRLSVRVEASHGEQRRFRGYVVIRHPLPVAAACIGSRTAARRERRAPGAVQCSTRASTFEHGFVVSARRVDPRCAYTETASMLQRDGTRMGRRAQRAGRRRPCGRSASCATHGQTWESTSRAFQRARGRCAGSGVATKGARARREFVLGAQQAAGLPLPTRRTCRRSDPGARR